MWKRIWIDPVWSKVISSSIIAAVGFVTYSLDWWPTIAGFFARVIAFSGENTLVSNWLLGVIGLFTLPSAVMLLAFFWQLARPDKSVSTKWQSYVTDVFFGLRWRWRYNGSTMSDMSTFCPHCDYQVFPDNASAYDAIDRIAFSCDSCGMDLGTFDQSFNSLMDKAKRFAQQKLRNGSWSVQNITLGNH